jgi:2,3-bisphosphoglycerate-dependent phosphoglycerate mutase
MIASRFVKSCTSLLRNQTKKTLMQSFRSKYTIVLVRHGESTWNQENRFTGWYDCPLSEKGHLEAKAAGKLIKENGYTFDIAYTSMLQRAIRTLWYSLEELNLMYIPINNRWQLNERHYGGLQGLNKQETADKHGMEKVMTWRRSYDIPPPECDLSSEHCPANDPKYANNKEAAAIRTESLSTTLDRVLPLWNNEIVPTIKSGKKLIIAAHGNSLRALVKHLDNIPEEDIPGLNIPTGAPLVYELDENMKPIKHANAIAPLSGHYLGNQEDIRARIEGVKNQTKK